MKITSRWTGATVFESDAVDNIFELVKLAAQSGTDLSGANLIRANLRGANLIRANLGRADLREADLRGADLVYAPKIENLDAKILAAIENGGALNMSTWHTCETTHCRAGWAIHLAGEAGKVLESAYGAAVAGSLIYNASTGAVPNFYATNEEALEDMRKAAADASLARND